MVINRKGLTLVESLISIALLSALLISLLGAFFISRLGAVRAKHRISATNIARLYMEQELEAGYDGGSDGEADYYATVTSAGPVSITIDDRGTADASDDLVGTITPDPYYPYNMEDEDGDDLQYSGLPYKVIGFVVNWNEDLAGQACSERVLAYVAYHASS